MVEHPAAVRQVLGSTPSVPLGETFFLGLAHCNNCSWQPFIQKSQGPNRDLNPGPPAPKAGIIPLDHLAAWLSWVNSDLID